MLCHHLFIQCPDTSNDNYMYIVEYLFMYIAHITHVAYVTDRMTRLAEQF